MLSVYSQEKSLIGFTPIILGSFSKELYLGTWDANSPEKVWPMKDGEERVHKMVRVSKRQKGGFAIGEAPGRLSKVETAEFGFVG